MVSPIPLYRFSHWLYKIGLHKASDIVHRLNYGVTGCLLPAQMVLGKRAHFPDFGAGVIINASTTIGDDFVMLPHSVIGQNVRAGREVVKAQIVIGNGVVIGAGAKVIASGLLEIGDGAVIGANAVVLRSVPPHTMAVGIPARLAPIKKHEPADAALR